MCYILIKKKNVIYNTVESCWFGLYPSYRKSGLNRMMSKIVVKQDISGQDIYELLYYKKTTFYL